MVANDKQMENLKDQLDVLWNTMLLGRKQSQVVSTMMLIFIQIPCAIMNHRKVIISVCISLLLKENNEMNVKLLLTLDIPKGFLVSSIIVVYSGFKYKVIISQQQCQHSPFEINKHQ